VQIETESFWQAKIDYLHANPCRKGLVVQPEYWRFPSASHWLCRSHGQANDVILTPIMW
jgi:hypothetical protein